MQALSAWVRRQPSNVKSFLSVLTGITALVFLCMFVHHRNNLAVAVHFIGICVLIYKLSTEKTCAGLSPKSQELTALCLAVSLYFGFAILDAATMATTLWVIYKIRFKLRSTYMEDKDNFEIENVVIPCAVLSLLIHPSTNDHILDRILVAFWVNLKAVSVLPQLRVMQNTRIVEPFTAHYVFALGVARFLGCAYLVLQV